MDLALILTVIGTGIATVGLIYGFLRNFKIDINNHIDRLEKRMESSEKRMESSERRMDGHAQRIDQLYQIFMDSQKEFNQKFYDLLKLKKGE